MKTILSLLGMTVKGVSAVEQACHASAIKQTHRGNLKTKENRWVLERGRMKKRKKNLVGYAPSDWKHHFFKDEAEILIPTIWRLKSDSKIETRVRITIEEI